MGNLFVTQKQLRDEIGLLRDEISTFKYVVMIAYLFLIAVLMGLGQLVGKQGDERKYEAGNYYMHLKRLWSDAKAGFVGKADEWKYLRNKDTAALEYYKDPEKRGEHNVRYFKDKFPRDPLFPVAGQSRAHLIPNDPSCSLAWLSALSIVTGIGDSGDNDWPLSNMNLRSFVEGKASAPLGPNTNDKDVPLKAWNWNFLKLPENHGIHFDKVTGEEKHMIAAPIWDPKKIGSRAKGTN